MMIQNERIEPLIGEEYSLSHIQAIVTLLEQENTLSFPILENGLFPAAEVVSSTEYTGYGNVWVRDNIYLAYAHYFCGQTDIAVKTVTTLIHYFQKHQLRFLKIINGQVNPEDVMQRPHIRFNGETLEEINQEWNHAQNDALGYFVWFYCKLVREKKRETNIKELEIISLFITYFDAIKYWQDEDSGHWEEDRKIEASSIGVVVAALIEFKRLFEELSLTNHLTVNNRVIELEFLNQLITQGKQELYKILPAECMQEPPKNRRYDSALLFLIYPLQIIKGDIADKILADIIEDLQGDYGIRRYLKDSFWCKKYQDIPLEIRTTLSTEREQWFQENDRVLRLGEEAQWCIFDPIISAIFGLKFQQTKDNNYLQKQIHYLNRSLGQITPSDSPLGGFKCPELYYLENEAYVPGDATPLLWTQANLKVALEMMKGSLLQL